MGGGALTKAFQEADLIDVWSVAFVPTLLGAGIPLFPPAAFAERRLALVRMGTYPSGVVELRYERPGPPVGAAVREPVSPRTSRKRL
jgi:dihydrofolate reductase